MRMHILIVEDDAFLRKVDTCELERAGYKVACAEDGEQAIAAIATHCPDLLMSDIQMPRKDGFTMLRELRANPTLKSLPVMMLTSREDEHDLELAKQLGVLGYFVKSHDGIEQLVQVAKEKFPPKA